MTSTEHTVEVHIYIPIGHSSSPIISSSSSSSSRSAISAMSALKAITTCHPLITGTYPWFRDRFMLEDDGMLSWTSSSIGESPEEEGLETGESKANKKNYFPSSSSFFRLFTASVNTGICLADVWLVTFLVLCLSQLWPEAICFVTDSDGEFMFIEGAECLPEYLEGDCETSSSSMSKNKDKDSKTMPKAKCPPSLDKEGRSPPFRAVIVKGSVMIVPKSATSFSDMLTSVKSSNSEQHSSPLMRQFTRIVRDESLTTIKEEDDGKMKNSKQPIQKEQEKKKAAEVVAVETKRQHRDEEIFICHFLQELLKGEENSTTSTTERGAPEAIFDDFLSQYLQWSQSAELSQYTWMKAETERREALQFHRAIVIVPCVAAFVLQRDPSLVNLSISALHYVSDQLTPKEMNRFFQKLEFFRMPSSSSSSTTKSKKETVQEKGMRTSMSFLRFTFALSEFVALPPIVKFPTTMNNPSALVVQSHKKSEKENIQKEKQKAQLETHHMKLGAKLLLGLETACRLNFHQSKQYILSLIRDAQSLFSGKDQEEKEEPTSTSKIIEWIQLHEASLQDHGEPTTWLKQLADEAAEEERENAKMFSSWAERVKEGGEEEGKATSTSKNDSDDSNSESWSSTDSSSSCSSVDAPHESMTIDESQAQHEKRRQEVKEMEESLKELDKVYEVLKRQENDRDSSSNTGSSSNSDEEGNDNSEESQLFAKLMAQLSGLRNDSL